MPSGVNESAAKHKQGDCRRGVERLVISLLRVWWGQPVVLGRVVGVVCSHYGCRKVIRLNQQARWGVFVRGVPVILLVRSDV